MYCSSSIFNLRSFSFFFLSFFCQGLEFSKEKGTYTLTLYSPRLTALYSGVFIDLFVRYSLPLPFQHSYPHFVFLDINLELLSWCAVLCPFCFNTPLLRKIVTMHFLTFRLGLVLLICLKYCILHNYFSPFFISFLFSLFSFLFSLFSFLFSLSRSLLCQ